VPVVRSTVLIDALPGAVAGLLRDADAADEAMRRGGHRFAAPRRLLAAGDEVLVAARLLPGVRIRVRTRVTAVTVEGMSSVLVAGPLRDLVHTVTLTPGPAGTVMVDEVAWTAPLGPLGRLADAVLVRRLVRRMQASRAEVLAGRQVTQRTAPVVVATALVHGGRVLAARRTRPPELAGRWELPGGRVEPGESESAAVVRECAEELGTRVRVLGRIGTDLPIAAGVLRVHAAEPVPGAAQPRALEHSALRWVGPAEVPGVDWVDADRAVVADLVALLDGSARPAPPP
jgi:8-oxo-dGTP diphosphatase